MIKILAIVLIVGVALVMFGRGRAPEPLRDVKLDPDAAREVEALVRDGRKLEAIKACRLASGCQLVEAKNYVERMQQRLGL